MPTSDPPKERPQRGQEVVGALSEARTIKVRTGDVALRGLQAGIGAWLAWAVSFGALGYHFARDDDALAWNTLGGTLALLGLVPALFVTHLVSRRTQQHLSLAPGGLLADQAWVVDFRQAFDACVLALGKTSALVIVQKGNHVILFGQDLEEALGDRRAWGPRWHAVSLAHTHRHEKSLKRGSLWGHYWTVGSRRDAVIAGAVEDSEAFRELALMARERAPTGAHLSLPTKHGASTLVSLTAAGVLFAFGEAIDTKLDFAKSYIWTLGRRNLRQDADAILLRQGERALCLSMVERPGGWPRVGSVLAAAPEFPSPELPREQVIDPVVFGVVDELLSLRKQHLRKARTEGPPARVTTT